VARGRTEDIEFVPADCAAVVAAMDQLSSAHRGWINFLPEVRPEDEPPPPGGLTLLLAGAVHDIPLCTWVAGTISRRGPQPDSVGVQHAAGSRVLQRLAGAGLGLPPGWGLVQDHPRRGLVVTPAPHADRGDVLRWLLEVGETLSAVPLTGRWKAEIHLAQ